jgi:hypothetical protein
MAFFIEAKRKVRDIHVNITKYLDGPQVRSKEDAIRALDDPKSPWWLRMEADAFVKKERKSVSDGATKVRPYDEGRELLTPFQRFMVSVSTNPKCLEGLEPWVLEHEEEYKRVSFGEYIIEEAKKEAAHPNRRREPLFDVGPIGEMPSIAKMVIDTSRVVRRTSDDVGDMIRKLAMYSYEHAEDIISESGPTSKSE